MSGTLPRPELLELAGADAVSFAQAQFSSDVRALADNHWQWSAWLSPKGRVRAFFQLLRNDRDHLRLLLRGGTASELAEALQRFVFRAKVELSPIEDVSAVALSGTDEIQAIADHVPTGFALQRANNVTVLVMPGQSPRWLGLVNGSNGPAMSAQDLDRWRLSDIRAGLPEMAPVLHEQLLPTWLGLDRLGAASVSKGCYPGQEIVSRLHFRGGNTRSLYRIGIETARPPHPGDAIRMESADGSLAGQIVQAALASGRRFEALASLQDALADQPLRVESSEPTLINVFERFD